MEYGDIRILQSDIQQVVVQNHEVNYVLKGYETGAGVRILKGGNWGFSSTTDISSSGLANVVKRAHKTCLSTPASAQLAPTPPVTQVDTSLHPETDHIIEVAKTVESALYCSSSIISGRVGLRCSSTVHHFFNTEGSHIQQHLTLAVVDLRAVARRDGKTSESTYTCAFTDLKSLKEDALLERALETAQESIQRLDAGTPENGEFPVILGSSLASVFIHEAVGHRMEADEVMRPHSIMTDKVGRLLTHPSLTVVDTTDNDQEWYTFDDEGVPKKETVLIEQGVVKGFIHDRQTAHTCGTDSTGNSRASSYDTRPLVRMTNIKALQGDMSREEMIEKCKNGLFLDGFVGGAAGAGGMFRFAARGGYRIEDGELTSPVGRSTISSSTLDALSCISGVGTDVTMHYSQCIKRGQGVMVGLGSPSLLISQLRVGG
jgi:TldD protein